MNKIPYRYNETSHQLTFDLQGTQCTQTDIQAIIQQLNTMKIAQLGKVTKRSPFVDYMVDDRGKKYYEAIDEESYLEYLMDH